MKCSHWKKLEQIEVRDCSLSFGAESFVIESAFQKFKDKISRTIILLVILYECETCSLTLREEHGLRVLRRIFVPKRDKVTGSGENYIMRSLMICTHHPILFR